MAISLLGVTSHIMSCDLKLKMNSRKKHRISECISASGLNLVHVFRVYWQDQMMVYLIHKGFLCLGGKHSSMA